MTASDSGEEARVYSREIEMLRLVASKESELYAEDAYGEAVAWVSKGPEAFGGCNANSGKSSVQAA